MYLTKLEEFVRETLDQSITEAGIKTSKANSSEISFKVYTHPLQITKSVQIDPEFPREVEVQIKKNIQDTDGSTGFFDWRTRDLEFGDLTSVIVGDTLAKIDTSESYIRSANAEYINLKTNLPFDKDRPEDTRDYKLLNKIIQHALNSQEEKNYIITPVDQSDIIQRLIQSNHRFSAQIDNMEREGFPAMDKILGGKSSYGLHRKEVIQYRPDDQGLNFIRSASIRRPGFFNTGLGEKEFVELERFITNYESKYANTNLWTMEVD